MRFTITALALFAGVALGSAIPAAAPEAAPAPAADARPIPGGDDYSSDYYYQPQVHYVTVGGPGILAYNPPMVYANKGDKIIFEFLQVNHTLTSADFHNPCMSNGVADTGFVPNAAAVRGITRTLIVHSKHPQFFYCRQANHCAQGMVFALNPSKHKSFEKFQQAAMATDDDSNGSSGGPN